MATRRHVTSALLIAGSILVGSCTSIAVHPWTAGETGGEDFIVGIDTRVRALMRRHHIPGLSIGVVEGDSTVLLRGYGNADREQGIPATPDTHFPAYSIAKVITAIETLRIVEEGLVDLDAPMNDVLSEWREPRRRIASDPVTLRHILSHRSGLPRNSNYHEPLSVAGVECLLRQVESLEEAWAAYPVGYRYKYSNVGYNVLGRLIELERDELFAIYMTETMLPSIGMPRSAFLIDFLPEDSIVATGYSYADGRYAAHPPHDHILLASGNLFTTSADLSSLMKLLLSATSGAEDFLLDQATLEAMFVPQFAHPGDPQRNGLGWMTSEEALGELMVWHQGGDYDANSVLAMLPDSGLGVCVLTNTGSFDGSALVALAMDVFQALAGTSGAESEPAEGGTEAATGLYVAFGDIMEISRRGGDLLANLGPVTLTLRPEGLTELGSVYSVHHWLDDLSLGGLFPVDLETVRIIFPPSIVSAADHLIVAVSDLAYEHCPRYPVPEEVPEDWARAEGAYQGCEIVVTDETIRMTHIGYLSLYDTDTYLVLGGPFAGETVEYDPLVDAIRHQGITYPRIVAGQR